MNMFLSAYLGSAILAVLVTPVVIRLARRIGAMDQPCSRGVHERPVPRIGGVAIFLAAAGSIMAILVPDSPLGEASHNLRQPLTALLCSSTLIFLVGLADDLRGLSAKLKLAAELAIAGLLCLAGVRISSIALTDEWVLHLGGWGTALTILWIVGVTNAVNLSDGLDGLAAGVCAIACAVIAIFAIHSGQIIMVVIMLALLGSLCGFLLFNFNPARIFMGDSGSLFLGFTIGASSVMCVAKSAALVGLTLPALALGIPIFDTLLAALRRYLEGRSIFAPDRSHFHHRLLDLGLHQRQAVILIYGATLLAAGLGLLMLLGRDLGSLVIFSGVLLLILLLFRAVGAIHVRQTMTRLQQKHTCARQTRDEQQTFERLQLGVRAVRTPGRRWQAICEAAEQLQLAWVSLQVTDAQGNRETTIWRRADKPAGFARIMTMKFPLGTIPDLPSADCEIAVLVNGSLQSAHHRAELFVRLTEEAVGTGTVTRKR
jgi:UDP-GlcNAc:undecaprenyl-phosphate/decaprenyl-phosphate GlcNAc-1-phosphate transferase